MIPPKAGKKINPHEIADKLGVRWHGSVPFWTSRIQRWELENGLSVLTLVDRSAPVAAYMTWYRVGSRHEKPGKTGLAHLFEHLMFNETENLRAGQFDRKLEAAGAETNAATWFDWTYYYESVPKDALKLAIRLEADRMARLVLRAPQVASEKEVVANERRYRVDDDVDGVMNELLYSKAFGAHPYHWPTIGWMEDIQNFAPEDCEEFYRTFYAPNNATIVVCGDFNTPATLRRIKDAYGALSRAEIPAEDTHPEPHQLEERRFEIQKPTPTDRIMIGWRGPALGDPEHAPLSVLTEILFGGRASRLHHALVIDKEIATELRGWVSTFRDPGLFEISAVARPGRSADEILAGIDEAIERAKDGVPSEMELARAKSRLELGTLQSLETAAGKAEQIGFFETVLGDPAGVLRRLEAIRRVGPGDVRRAVRRFLDGRARTIVIAHPEGSA